LKPYPAKYFHLIEHPAGVPRRHPLPLRPLDELLPLGRHDLLLLLSHGASQDVGFAERVSGHRRGDLHDLLLVDDDAVGLLEDGRQERVGVLHLDLAVPAFDEIVDQAAADRTGPVQGVDRDEILEPFGLQAPEDVPHPLRFELEHAGGSRLAEEVVDRGVVQEQRVEVRPAPRDVGDRGQGIVDQRQRLQSEEIHLEEADLLDVGHRELRRDRVVRSTVQRRELDDRLRCDHDPRGVGRRVADQPFEALADVDQLLHARVGLVGLLERGDLP
jgi:hypothetical protein